MNKWIAEFELEDGDIMPEHMDLEYKGAKIDFHCRPLEQEPFKPMVEIDLYSVIKQKYIEREVLDKIRAEIEMEKLEDSPNFCVKAHNNAVDRVLGIIDKYKAESEDT